MYLLKLVAVAFILSVLLAACSPQDGEITAFYVDNRTDQNLVIEYELVGGETQTSGVIAIGTKKLLFTIFGSCVDASIIGEARIYTPDEALLRTVTEASEWRKEPLPNSCAWYLDSR